VHRRLSAPFIPLVLPTLETLLYEINRSVRSIATLTIPAYPEPILAKEFHCSRQGRRGFKNLKWRTMDPRYVK
jgi:hypothetical protein